MAFLALCCDAHPREVAATDGSAGARSGEPEKPAFVPYPDGWTFTFGPSRGVPRVLPTPAGYLFSALELQERFIDSEGHAVSPAGRHLVAEIDPDRIWLWQLGFEGDFSLAHVAADRIAVVAETADPDSKPLELVVSRAVLTVYERGEEIWSDSWRVTPAIGEDSQIAALGDGTFVVWTGQADEPLALEPGTVLPQWTARLRHYTADGLLVSDSAIPNRRQVTMANTKDGDVYILGKREQVEASGLICLERRRVDGEQLWESCFGTEHAEPRAVLALSNGGAAVLVNNVATFDVDEDFDASPERELHLQPQVPGYFLRGSALVLVNDAGHLLSALPMYATDTTIASALAEDSEGTIYVGGTIRGEGLLFEHEWLTYSDDLFVAKFTPDGVAQGARVWGGIGVETLESLAIDDDDSIIAGGSFTDRVNFGQGGETDVFVAGTEPNGSAFLTKFRFYPEQVAEYPQVDCDPLPVMYIAPDFQACLESDRGTQYGRDCDERYFDDDDPGYDECLEYGSLMPASDDVPSYCQVTYDAFSCP